MDSEQAFSEDTPQVEGSTTEKPFSFDDVIFGPEGDRTAAQPPPRTPEQVAADVNAQETVQEPLQPIPTQEPAPVIPPPELTPQVEGQTQPDGSTYQARNDDKRFEYWQSQAAKLQNQVTEMQNKMPMIEHLERNPQMMQQQAPQAPVQQQEEAFPPPPEKPQRPRAFSREAAYTDSASDSAAYLDEMEDWRDSMDEYNSLKSEYDSLKVQEYLQEQESLRQRQNQQIQAQQQQHRQVNEVSEYVQANYGMDTNQAAQFIKDYSNPESISMDNLVQLWRIQNGQTIQNQPTPSPIPAAPSPAFQQTQRAQQVPPTMGVVSGKGNSVDNSPAGQKFMEALIGTHNDNKAF
tara:strand:+ start:2739 stop:3785 length:1047 start_codon:yes stop_codon:yes gene_type:complete